MARAARLDHATRQGQILEKAARVFCERGYEKTSMGDVAAAVGMTKAGVYHHIAGKEDLLAAIMHYGMDLFEERVLAQTVRIKAPLPRLRATVKGHLLLVLRDRPKEVTVILHEGGALPAAARARLDARKKRYIRFLEKTIRELVMRKIARPVDPTVAAYALLGMVNWTYQWFRPGGRLDEEGLADQMTDFYLHGLLRDDAVAEEAGDQAARAPSGAGERMTREIGILGWGAYVPEGRVPAKVLASAWGRNGEGRLPVKEKSVPGLDEDTVTMAIEAARHALARAGEAVLPQQLGAVFVGTESKPYAVKPSGTVVAEAIGAVPWTSAADFEFACKAGTEALRAAAAFVGAGLTEAALAIGMDAAQGKPGDHLEYTAAAGGGAVIVGPASDRTIARIDGSCSYVTDTPDFFRRQHLHYPEHGHRFTGEPAYFRHVEEASKRLLTTLGRAPSDYRFAVFHQPNPKFVRKAAAALGFTEAQVGPTAVVDRIGNTYSGASLLGLAAALDRARPGDRIFLCSYGSGAGSDAFSFTVTDGVEAARDRAPLLDRHLDRRRAITDYGTYLRRAGAVRTL